MKKIIFAASIAACTVLTACAENKGTETKSAVTAQNEQSAPVEKAVANQEMDIEIEGMSCVKGCGASIRKELKATGGVADVTYDFVEGRAKNIAKIKFDDAKVSVDDIILAITTLDEHKYSIGEHSVKPVQ